MTSRLLVTCEHGGNIVPRQYRSLFRGAETVLASHRGFDLGALELARMFAKQLDAPLLAETTTRLLVELNRSLGHPRLYSEYTRVLPRPAREELLAHHYFPYRKQFESDVAAVIAAHKIALHVSVHTFTPTLDGTPRKADVGLLYDPRRPLERILCAAWQSALRTERSDLVVRRNYPYHGAADGFTTHLRRLHGSSQYVGIELEVNQRWATTSRSARAALYLVLADTFRAAQSACKLSAPNAKR